ncbi:MAG: translation initiation factor IF-2 [Candidatus Pacebacteria bacterium]|nr:translation initiation factor IF-2 [Candidatus Paceibacterota bacterium]
MTPAKKKTENIIAKPPVVVVLGHIDHGKTSLLMAIKDFKILSKESGGITQHVGAYQVKHNDKKITFIDTPGHESFSAIRSRGSKVADIGILVVDASEGLKRQTKEAISHIKKANLNTIIALNKIDKPDANPEMVKQQLSEEDMLVESYGGHIPCVEISAKTGKGIPDLLDLILLVSEINELSTSLDDKAAGVIIEAYLDSKRGPTATAIVEQGVLNQGDVIGTETAIGKVKNLGDFLGKEIKSADPSDPIVIVGFEKAPKVGEKFHVYESLDEAKGFLKERVIRKDKSQIEDPNKKYLRIILKADTIGSLEALEDVLSNLPQETVGISIVRSEIGNVNESDIKLAKMSEAMVIAFRVKTDKIAESSSQKEKIKIYDTELIYTLSQEVRALMEKKLKREKERIDLGRMEVTVIFRTEKNRQIFGGIVLSGEIEKGSQIEIYRDTQKMGIGKIIDLQANKKSFTSMKEGKECAILYQGNEKVKEGDEIVSFREEYKREEL